MHVLPAFACPAILDRLHLPDKDVASPGGRRVAVGDSGIDG